MIVITAGKRLFRVLELILYVGVQMIIANGRIAMDVLTPGHRMRPAVLAIPLKESSNATITLLANIITLTPGTLTLDVSPDRSILYVHVMYVGDIERERAQIEARLKERVQEVLDG